MGEPVSDKYRDQAEQFASFLLSLPKGRRKRVGDAVRGNCPTETHPDKHPSFSYDVGKDAWSCSCGHGKGSELRSTLGWSNGANGQENAALRPNVEALAPIPFSSAPTRPPDCIHPYQNGNRKLRWYEPDGSKRIVWEHEVGGQWITGKQGETGLYNEPSILAADTVFLTESESDADALATLGLISSCHGYGAAANLKDDQAAMFRRKRVPILEHADDAGRKWATAQLQLLTRMGADAWIVHLAEPHKDIRDYIKAGADKFAVEFIAQVFEPKDLIAEPSGKLFDRTSDVIEYILDPLLSKGCILQLQGNPKAGKSSFALAIALSCSIGRWTSDRFNFVGGPRRTLYISYEDSARRLKRRSRSYLDAMEYRGGFPEHLLLFQRAPELDLATPEGRAKIARIVRQNKIEVLFIDTLSWVASGDENTKKDMQPVLATLRYIAEEYGTAVCILHHTRKTSQGGDVASVSERGRGSSAIAAAADSILDFGSRVSPNHTLCRFISKDSDEDEFIVVYKTQSDGSINWKLEDSVEREDAIQCRNTIKAALQELLKTSPEGVRISAISAACPKISKNTIRNYLDLMEKELEIFHEIGPRNVHIWLIRQP